MNISRAIKFTADCQKATLEAFFENCGRNLFELLVVPGTAGAVVAFCTMAISALFSTSPVLAGIGGFFLGLTQGVLWATGAFYFLLFGFGLFVPLVILVLALLAEFAFSTIDLLFDKRPTRSEKKRVIVGEIFSLPQKNSEVDVFNPFIKQDPVSMPEYTVEVLEVDSGYVKFSADYPKAPSIKEILDQKAVTSHGRGLFSCHTNFFLRHFEPTGHNTLLTNLG